MTTSRASLSHPNYRPDIDGLRAFAILSVVLYHAFPARLNGGFVGVDIFFVISGYLISTIVFSNLETGTFSFYEFYARRVKRIFPALLLVLFFCLAFGWYVLLGDEYKQLGKHMLAGAGFASNFVLWGESGYFDNVADTKPLLHLWSLGIEEQFYIVWPLLVWLAWKTRSGLLLLTIAILSFSFFLNLYGVRSDAVATFYSPLTRFWELSAGSLLAYLVLQKHIDPTRLTALQSNAISMVGFAFLLLAIFITNKDHAFPGWWALLPVLGCALVITAGTGSWLNNRVFSNKVAVWFGLISFPLYLWHWPLLSFAKILQGFNTTKTSLIAIAVAVLLAGGTYGLVERPMRFGRRSGAKMASLLSLMVLTGFGGYVVYQNDGFMSRKIAHDGIKITEARSDWHYSETKLIDGKITGLNVLAGKEAKTVLYIGSSIVGQYYPRAKYIYSLPNKPLLTTVFASRNHCVPIPLFDLISTPENINCTDYYRAAIELAKAPSVATVVFGGHWPNLMRGGGVTEQGDLFARDLQALRQLGKRVVIISKPPAGVDFSPRVSLLTNLGNAYISRDKAEDRNSLDSLRRFAAIAGVEIVDPYDYLCEGEQCPTIRNGEPLYMDSAHMRASYAESSATFVDELSSR